MRIETLIRAWMLAKGQAEAAAWEQGFTGIGKERESPAELACRIAYMLGRRRQARLFWAATLHKVGLE
jgi:hypothetical protein